MPLGKIENLAFFQQTVLNLRKYTINKQSIEQKADLHCMRAPLIQQSEISLALLPLLNETILELDKTIEDSDLIFFIKKNDL